MATSSAALLELVADEDGDNIAAKREARTLALEWFVREWVRAQNLKETGPLEPTTHDVLDQLEFIRMAMPENVRPPRWGVASDATARQKLCRLRAKCGGRFWQIPNAAVGEYRRDGG